MKEQELYTALRNFCHSKNAGAINHTTSFVVTSISEGEDEVTFGTMIIDPKIPSTIEKVPWSLDLAQQIAIYYSRQSRETWGEAQEQAITVKALCDAVGDEKMREIVAKSPNKDIFATLMVKAIKENEVEKHGTG